MDNSLDILVQLKGIANWISKDFSKEEAELFVNFFDDLIKVGFSDRFKEKKVEA